LPGYNAVLVALRSRAKNLIAAARNERDRARLEREYAECVLRNKAKLIVMRMRQTGIEQIRQHIFRRALTEL
jgi:hypothetical protein